MGIENLPDILTVKQIADYLQLNEETIKRALQKKELIGFKFGKNWRIERECLAKWIEAKKNR